MWKLSTMPSKIIIARHAWSLSPGPLREITSDLLLAAGKQEISFYSKRSAYACVIAPYVLRLKVDLNTSY